MDRSAGRRFGELGEALAASYLRSRGWRILERNWRFHRKEIDLIAERDGLVAFIEVKARADGDWVGPLSAITARKRRDLEQAARGWLRARGGRYCGFRFDAIAVRRDRTGLRLEHIADAWRL